MESFSPQRFANSCGLACISYMLGKSEQDILHENPDILTVEKLNFIGLYCSEIVELLGRYGLVYEWSAYNPQLSSNLNKVGTIAYIQQLNHYLIYLQDCWADSHIFLKGIPIFGCRKELPYSPEYIVFKP